MARGPRVVVRRGDRVDRIPASGVRRTPRGTGLLLAIGATLGLVGLGEALLFWFPRPIEGGVPDFATLTRTLESLPWMGLGFGLIAFAAVRDPGPAFRLVWSVLLALLAAGVVGVTVLFMTSAPEVLGSVAPEEVPGARREVIRGALAGILHSLLFLYLVVAVWRARPGSA